MAPTAPVAPAATAQPSASFTPEQIAASRQAFYESQSKKSSSSAQPGKMTQSTIDALVNLNPAVSKAQIEYDELEANIGILGDRINGAVEFSAETPKLKTELETLLKGLPAAKNKLALLKSSAEVQLSGLENPQEIMDFYKVQEAVVQDRLKRAETEAAAKTAATGATAAAAVDKIPPPPDPTLGMSAVEKNLYNIETMRQEGPKQRVAEREARRIESNQQWNKAKEQVYDLIGGTQGLAELLNAQEQPLIEGIKYNANIPANKPRLANELAQKIREKIAKGTGNKKLESFEQKLERLGPQKVSQEEIIAAVVEEIIRAQESAVGKVRTMSRIPQSPQDIDLNVSGVLTPNK
jgi:hypothetical protein